MASHPLPRPIARLARVWPWILVAALASAGCRTRAPAPKTRAFYYWRTAFSLDAREAATLRRHHVERLYVRFFDVAPDRTTGAPAPVAPVAFRQRPPDRVEIVPVVFVANSVFDRASASAGDGATLAQKVWTLTQETAAGAGIQVRALQVDCDWTERTREAFFQFCRALGRTAHAAGAQLGATIRLHQIKYPQRTGVPPVDRGMLMFYNLGRLEPDPPRPSIFNAEDAGRYVDFLDRYPLPLDAVLPVFSWAIHGRAGRVIGLVEKIDAATLDAAAPALERLRPGHYRAAASTFFRGGYLQKGDTLTVEAMTPDAAHEAATLLARHFHPRAEHAIALFDLDERNLGDYGPTDLEALYSSAP